MTANMQISSKFLTIYLAFSNIITVNIVDRNALLKLFPISLVGFQIQLKKVYKMNWKYNHYNILWCFYYLKIICWLIK